MNVIKFPVGQARDRCEKLSDELSVRFGKIKKNYRCNHSTKTLLTAVASEWGLPVSEIFRRAAPIVHMIQLLRSSGIKEDDIFGTLEECIKELYPRVIN